jgi:hypothetical protein
MTPMMYRDEETHAHVQQHAEIDADINSTRVAFFCKPQILSLVLKDAVRLPKARNKNITHQCWLLP